MLETKIIVIVYVNFDYTLKKSKCALIVLLSPNPTKNAVYDYCPKSRKRTLSIPVSMNFCFAIILSYLYQEQSGKNVDYHHASANAQR